MAGVGMRLEGQDAALQQLGGMIARAQHPRGMFERIGASLVTSTQRRFETGTAPDGSPWPPSLRALAGGGKTLIDTARMMQSQTFVATDAAVEVGTNVIYAAIHQFGGDITHQARTQTLHRKRNKRSGKLSGFVKAGKGNFSQDVEIGAHTTHIPARPFLGIDDDDEREIILIAEDWLRAEARP
jgi:phage virion morphogenesis protein